MTGLIALTEVIVARTALVDPRRSRAAAARASDLYLDGYISVTPRRDQVRRVGGRGPSVLRRRSAVPTTRTTTTSTGSVTARFPWKPPATMLTQRLKGTREAFRDDRDEPIKSDLSRAAVVVTAVVHATWSRTVRRSALTSR